VTTRRVLPWLSLAALLGTVAWTSGPAGIAYLPFWLAAALPGVPLGLRVFGRHAMAWVCGLAIGYTMTCLVIWAVIAAGAASGSAFVLAWMAASATVVMLARRLPSPLVPLRPWTSQDTAALAGVLLLVPALMGAPYRNLGASDTDGRRYYRAYFTADFVWHMALTAELGRFEMPPRNPYMAHRPLNYYWTYFLVPAAVSSTAPAPVADIAANLKVNALCTGALLLSAIFLFAWSAGVRASAVALAVLLVVLAASAEGAMAIRDLHARGRPLESLRDMNVDAVTAWKYNGLRIDGVHRTMYYTPQHGLSCALGLLALATGAAGVTATLPAIVAAGLLLGAAGTMNPFLGAAFGLIYGLAILVNALLRRSAMRTVVLHAVTAIPLALAILWGLGNSMGEGAGQALTIGWVGHARHAPVVTLLLSLGPVLLPGVIGFLPDRRLPPQPARIALVGLIVGLFLLYFVVLSEPSWVGFRAGQILLAMLTLPLSRLLDRLLASGHRLAAAGIVGGVLIAGSPTTVVDVFNASDISNLKPGPGFPWTLTISSAQQQALAWVKRHTPATAIVQMEPLARGRGHWSFIPTFAERRMTAGLPISLLPVPMYESRSRLVQEIFTAPTAEDAHQRARSLLIDYLWVDQFEREAYPDGVARLDSAPTRFKPVFRNSEVTVYQVLADPHAP
jgi:hypothetical protein